MGYFKLLVAAAVAAVALLALAGTASATTLTVTTEGKTTDTVGGGAQLSAEVEAGTEWVLRSSFIGEVKCKESAFQGEVTNAGSSTETVSGSFKSVTLTTCNFVFTVTKPGTFELHTEGSTANGNGTLTSSHTEFTSELSGLHCIFTTNNTDLGQLTGTHTGHVLISVNAPVARTGGRSGAFCGSSATMNARYTVTSLSWGVSNFTNFTVD